MPLFQIQDDDRPAYVIARSMMDALRDWQRLVADENMTDDHTMRPEECVPNGVTYIADDREICVDHNWLEPL